MIASFVTRDRFQLPIAVQLGLLPVMGLCPARAYRRLSADHDRADGEPSRLVPRSPGQCAIRICTGSSRRRRSNPVAETMPARSGIAIPDLVYRRLPGPRRR